MATINSTSFQPRVEQFVSRFSNSNSSRVETLNQRKTELEKRTAVLTDLKSNLESLQTRVEGFTDVGTAAKLEAKSAVASDETFFTVEADATANTGVHSLFISQIARNDLAVTDTFKSSSDSLADELEDGIIFNIQVGSESAVTITVKVDEDDTNEEVLSAIAEAINTNAEGVTASVVQSSRTKVRLSLVAEEAGSENAITLSADDEDVLEELGFIDDDDDPGRSEFGNNSGGFLVEDTAELDATIEVNGIEVTTSSNTVSDVLQGVTIELRKAMETGSQAETITVSANTDEIVSQIEGFVEDYNTALNHLTEKISISNGERGELSNDFTYARLRLDLRSLLSTPYADASEGDPTLVTQVGLKISTTGELSIDSEDDLEDALAEDSDAVISIFTGTNGLANALEDLVEEFTSVGGTIDKAITTVSDQTTSLSNQISDFEDRTKIEENSLRQKYAELERTLALLNSQQTLLQRLGFTSTFGQTSTFQTSFGQSIFTL